MKIILQSISISLIIHVIFYIVSFVLAFYKTIQYQSAISFHSEDVSDLQTNIAFGTIHSPLLPLLSFFAIAIISGIIIVVVKKITILKKEQ